MINLNKLLAPNSGWTLLVASRINDNGEIIGRGYLHRTIHVLCFSRIKRSTKSDSKLFLTLRQAVEISFTAWNQIESRFRLRAAVQEKPIARAHQAPHPSL